MADDSYHTYKGIEYVSRPLELELDMSRGVLYLHDPTSGKTVLRICRIPDALEDKFITEGMTIDLSSVTPRGEGYSSRGKINMAPVFINTYGDMFTVAKEQGEIYLMVQGVPQHILSALKDYEFADITLGYTKR